MSDRTYDLDWRAWCFTQVAAGHAITAGNMPAAIRAADMLMGFIETGRFLAGTRKNLLDPLKRLCNFLQALL